jgi:integral membrane protein (TIGR01906 family)
MATPRGGRSDAGPLLRVLVFAGTVLVIITLAVLPLLTPAFIHPALDAAGSAGRLGVEAAVAHRLSDQSVTELLLGPGSFAFPGPDGETFYDAAERGHLADARLLLWLYLIAGAASLLGIGVALVRAQGDRRRALWRTISRAGASAAIVVIGLGVISLVAFGTLFSLFHEVFFPGGNWAFDPATQRLVQLYPFTFWQLAAAALGVLVFLFGLAAWWLGRSMTRRSAATRSMAHSTEGR